MMERWNPLWEDNRVLRLCQAWSRQTWLWMTMILHIKNFYYKDTENELKSYHNKTDWANFVRMQDSCLQYFMMKDTEEFSQFTDSVACREYTLPRDEDTSEPKGWIRGNTQIGPVLKVTTCCLQGKYGVEIRIMSVNKDNSHSWVRISHGLIKLVTDLSNNEQETSEMQFEEYALKLNASDVASRSKAKAKPLKRDSASSSTRIFPIGERTWTRKIFALRFSSVEETAPSSSSWKRTSRQWWSDWILENKTSSSESFYVLSSSVWRKVEEQHGRRRRTKEKISVLFWFFRKNSVPPSSWRSFRMQSHWSYFTRQCHCSGRFLQVHLLCRMCNQFTFHHQFRIDIGRT